MLHIILGILKIIGFLLLFILLVLLAVVLTVLFVPVRYRALVDLHENILVEGKVTWLLHLISVAVAFREKQLEYSVKIFGKSIVKSDPTEKSSEKKHINTKKDKAFSEEDDEEDELDITAVEEVKASSVESSVKNKPVNSTTPDTVKSVENKVSAPAEETKAKTQEESVGEKQSLSEKIRNLIQKIKDVIEVIKDKIRNIQQTIDSIKKKIEKVKKFLTAEETKNTLKHGKKEIIYLLRHIRPRRLEGNVRFGLDDPGSTGQILGYLSIIQGLTGNHLQVEGVFDQKLTEGTLFMKGHIRLCHFVKILLSMVLDKNVRITLKRLLKMRG